MSKQIQKLGVKERRALEQIKANFRRQMAEFHLTRDHLNEIFGLAFRAKLSEPVTRSQLFGSTYASSHGPHHQVRSQNHNPTGSKLVRAFIRHSKGENVGYRKLYAALTGHQYGAIEE